MLKSETGMPSNFFSRAHGFTLIEILIVIVIIGVTLRFAVLAFGDFGEKRRIVSVAEHIAETISLVREQAILESTPMAIDINQQGLNVYRQKDDNKWVAIKSSLFHNQHIPNKIKIKLNQNKLTRIIISDLGDMTPFTIFFGNQENSTMVSIHGFANGNLKVNKSP